MKFDDDSVIDCGSLEGFASPTPGLESTLLSQFLKIGQLFLNVAPKMLLYTGAYSQNYVQKRLLGRQEKKTE